MRLPAITLALIITCVLTTSAFAHRVNIFAWAEGTTIHTESFFSSGNKAQNCAVTATDKKTGKTVAKGTTDTNGEWSFTLSADAIKAKDPIIIALDAGQGHAGAWTLEAEDYTDAAPVSAPVAESQSSEVVKAEAPAQKATNNAATVTLTKSELDTLIRNAVRQELIPVKAKIGKLSAEVLQPTASMKDIFGGIGYILGLLGLAAFMHYRKKA
ncbi:hypothetical protein [Halodesulfovibrio aestuarii]|uniref:Nickel transport protein n=1 Tax=Halodesulfovibrio aestuarii TaxID=126333 RepID=A0A8G2F7T3_9BACT|nr:hypothetical protein [Halodesulfovibrio aestuarii]SHI53115.1 nickel transport protein [Halodesulfovibrio aestuarii]